MGEKLGRTEQAIQKIRTGSDYKRAEGKVKEELARHQTEGYLDRKDEAEVVEREVERVARADSKELTQEQHFREMQTTPAPASRNLCASDSEYGTPIRTVRRQLPVVPPTPVHENATISGMLLQQGSLSVQNMPIQKSRGGKR